MSEKKPPFPQGCVVLDDGWSEPATKELVELYLDGMELELLSSHFQMTVHEIVAKLSELFFAVPEPMQDTSAANYKKPWHGAETAKLWRLYAVRNPIPKIAEKLGRDELGVCYKLLTEQMVILPRSLAEVYGFDEDEFHVESKSDDNAKVCPICLDVVPYCKCYYEA